jgi:hypothetical protein
MNYRSDSTSFIEQLIIIESISGKVQAALPLERPETTWEWIEDENVVVVEGRAPTSSMQVSLWHWQSGGFDLQPIFPNEEISGVTNWNEAYISILGLNR